VTKMKNGATHLAYKAEQAVDLDTGAIVAITTLGGAVGDTTSCAGNLTGGRICGGRTDRHADRPGPVRSLRTKHARSRDRQGYHSGASLPAMREMRVRRLLRRRGEFLERPFVRFGSATTAAQLEGKTEQQAAVYAKPAARGKRAGKRISLRPARSKEYMWTAGKASSREYSCKPPHSIWP
jgi:hypothetical protein